MGRHDSYTDNDEEAQEAARDAAQEADFQAKIVTTFTCWCCAFRAMGANSKVIAKMATEHKDCTFEDPLYGVPVAHE